LNVIFTSKDPAAQPVAREYVDLARLAQAPGHGSFSEFLSFG
jgi:hypothetical protein